MFRNRIRQVCLLSIITLGSWHAAALAQDTDVDRLVAALIGDTPMIEDLRQLTDEIGGRPTGSAANEMSIEWAFDKFVEAGVTVQKEAFTMPGLWLERASRARVEGDVSFDVRVAAMPFSAGTSRNGIKAPLVDAGRGTKEDFSRLGGSARGAFALVELPELIDIDGLFREYFDAVGIESRAFDSGVAGIVYQSSRPNGVLYRHNASLNLANEHPLLVMERGDAARVLRLLRAGRSLDLRAKISLRTGGPYESYNVIGEIRGSERPNEIVIFGAHLDSWGLGTGANDNGCNVVMMIDIARQMKALGIKPARTIRFALWNGEEQLLHGSRGYTVEHAGELDDHVITCSIDIGSGRITGFFTGGRPELLAPVARALEPVESFGPFEQVDVPIVGTDNYDFMMQGVANLVGNHESYNYGPTYHASSDTFDKVDQAQLRVNAAITAALIYGFAEMEVTWKRHSRAEIQRMVDTPALGMQMESFGLMASWKDGTRGRSE